MKAKHIALLSLFALIACDDSLVQITDGGSDGKPCPGLPDLAPAPPKCAAAKGLSGDNLICVDFADPRITLAELTSQGWDFSVAATACPSWEIMGGLLQVKNFGGIPNSSNCGFLMPAFDLKSQNYKSVSLSMVHKVNLDSTQQRAQVMLGGDNQDLRLLDWMTGRQPRKQWTQTIDRGDLPAIINGIFQPLFKLATDVSGAGFKGWQIESIAIQVDKGP